jgi:hypothetical protein
MMLQKLRRAMVNPERTSLTECVEVDECFVGGLDRELRGGRQHGTKALVVVAVEVRGAGSGRVRMQVVEDASTATLTGFVRGVVEPGAIVHTDGWTSYRRLAKLGYEPVPERSGPGAWPRTTSTTSCLACIASSATSRPGCKALTAASRRSICRSKPRSTDRLGV